MYKVWSGYSEAELQLLLRFANEGYRAVLEATEKLKGLIDAPKRGRRYEAGAASSSMSAASAAAL